MSKTGPIRMQVGPLKNHVAHHVKRAEDFIKKDVPDDDEARAAYVHELQVTHNNLESISEKLRKKNDEWAALVQELNSEDELQHYTDKCDEIMALLFTSDDFLTEMRTRLQHHAASSQHQGPTAPAASAALSSGSSPSHPHSNAFKAPKIKLPTFSGNYMEFKQFWSIFETNIHNHPHMSKTEKYTYLLSQLEGDAKRAITGIIICDDNYDTAVALLKSRFDRADDRIITMLYSELNLVQPSTSKTSEKQRTLDDCERIFRQLESAGEDINSNKSLVFTLLSKFPAGMVKDLQRYYNVGANSKLNDVREGLNKSIMDEETTAGVISDMQAVNLNGRSSTPTPPKDGRGSGANSRSDNPMQYNGGTYQWTPSSSQYNEDNSGGGDGYNTSALPAIAHYQHKPPHQTNYRPNDYARPTNGGAQFLSPPGGCYFCGEHHFNGDCTNYTSAKSRVQRLSEVNRCTRCLKPSRHAKTACPVHIKCIHCRTDEDHASALCYKEYPETSTVTITMPGQPPVVLGSNAGAGSLSSTAGDPTLKDTTSGGVTALNHDAKPALFQTAKTTVINPENGEKCVVRLALDTMSSRSYIRDPVARKLGLTSDKSDKLCVSVFGTTKTLEVPTSLVKFEVTFRDGKRQTIEANTTRVICQASPFPSDWTSEERKVMDRYHTSLADDPYDINGTIDILIGANTVWDFIEGPRRSTECPTLALIPSKFGLMLSGEAQHESASSQPAMLCITDTNSVYPSELGHVTTETKHETAYPDVDEYWLLEKIGITDDPNESDDDKALENFQQTVQFNEGRYQVALPWIEEKQKHLPPNYEVAYDRLRSLAKRLRQKPDLLNSYRDILKLQADRGIIETVPPDQIETQNTTHYLPHQAVLKDTSNTTKVRIVYDAATKKTRHAFSLNDCLMRGPVILPDLCQLVMRMRVHETVVISDIEKAFLQVGLQPQDRDVTRFLWFKDDTNPVLPLQNNIEVKRFTRVNFGVISSPFLLGATIDHHLTKENSVFAESLRKDIYVDNVISGIDDQDPVQYYRDLKTLFEKAGMNIQEFCSNSRELMESIPECDRVKQTDAKVLGLKWDSGSDDTLRLAPTKVGAPSPTKRTVLRKIQSVFDPLGFFQPVLVPGKWLLQKLWELKYSWDKALTADLASEWGILQKYLEQIQEFRIPRFIGRIEPQTSLAVFCDASMSAYATSVYLRCRQDDGTWSTNLIFAKTRLAPTKAAKARSGNQMKLPRLELLGSVIGVRAGKFCRDGLGIPDANIDFFIDSQCVLRWISSRGMLKRFVANRVEEIRKTTNSEFHYVKSEENPADYGIGTRGMLPDELFSSEIWWKGPAWLSKDRSQWPESPMPPINDKTFQEIQEEIKPVFFSHTLAAVDKAPPHVNFLGIDPNDVSQLSKLIRISAICLKFVKQRVWSKLSATTRDSKPGLKSLFGRISDDNSITANDYATTKLQWVKCVQNNHFVDVLEALVSNQRDEQVPSIVHQLGLQLDSEGLLRSHGRYEHADLPTETRRPLLLPKNDRFTTLIVEDIHEITMHSGVSHTLSQVRLEFWIPHGRALVRKLVAKCLMCRRFKTAKPYKLPPMPPWPRERVERAAPFQSIGLDYFGPVNVTVNGVTSKMWVCLFTCLTTRAVHLESVMDFSAQEFLHSLIRFASRRGVPKLIISDNAAQFQLVKILGDKAWRFKPTDESITSYAANAGIEWRFITEFAPWQGGFCERLVGLVKSTLKTTIRNKLLSWTDMVTLLTEAEAVVNSRPITYVGDDHDAGVTAIRPCDFLLVRPCTVTDSPDGSEVQSKDFGEAGKRLVSIWKQRCRTLNKLWRRWYDEYLLSLRERRKVSHKAGRSDVDKTPLVHQIVLISDSDAPRGQWRLGRITSLLPGHDGRIRAAELKLSNGCSIRRPLNLLVPLEVENVSDEPEARNQPTTTDDNDDDQQVNTSTDNDDFFGFSDEDVQRTIDALQRLGGPDSGGAVHSA